MTLFVGGLKRGMRRKDLYNTFSNYGIITDINIIDRKSYAFVTFSDLENAKTAKAALNGTFLHGTQINVEWGKRNQNSNNNNNNNNNNMNKNSSTRIDNSQNTKVFVGCLPPSLSTDDLRKLFSIYGEVTNVQLHNSKGKKPRFGYITFTNHDDAQDAIKNLDKTRIFESRINVNWSTKEQGKFKNTNRRDGKDFDQKHPKGAIFYISGIPKSVTEKELFELFQPFGAKLARIYREEKFKKDNFAFVQFQNTENAFQAKEKLDGELINNERISITWYDSHSDLERNKKQKKRERERIEFDEKTDITKIDESVESKKRRREEGTSSNKKMKL